MIFATGYRPSLGYLAKLGALAPDGMPRQHRGISSTVPGLAYVGLERQRTLSSATVRGVGPDAARVVRHLQRTLQQPARCCWWLPEAESEKVHLLYPRILASRRVCRKHRDA